MTRFFAASAILALSLHAACALAQSAPAADRASELAPACQAKQGKVDEQGFVRIGGIEQWVTVRGDSCANPVILFVHGGPGNPLSPYADNLFGAWARDFTLVHWDQRGAGKTYGRSTPAPDDPLTIERLRDDGNEVAAYVQRRLGAKKVILWGSSWGSILAVHMARARPELFHAYLGTAQVVGYRENQAAGYAKLTALAREAGDKEALAVLDAVGAPPWTDPRSFGKVRRVIRRYEAKTTTPAPAAWWKAPAEYTTPKTMADYEAGEEYSFLQFVGMRGDGMFSRVDLPALGTEFAIPVFLVHGAQDLLCTPDVTRRYYDSLKAPQKDLVVLDRVGHDPNQAMLDAQYRILRERILPLVK